MKSQNLPVDKLKRLRDSYLEQSPFSHTFSVGQFSQVRSNCIVEWEMPNPFKPSFAAFITSSSFSEEGLTK